MRLSDVQQKPHSVERVTVCLCLTLSASASCSRLIRSLNILLRGKKCARVLFEKKKKTHTLCFISGFHLVWTLMVLSDSYLVSGTYVHKYALRSTSLLPCYLCNDLTALGKLTFKSKLLQYSYRAITASLLISLVVTALDELKLSSCCSGRALTVQVRPIKSLDPLNWILLTYLNYKLH